MRTINLTKSGDYVVKLSKPGDTVLICSAIKASGSENIVINVTVIHQAPQTSAKTVMKAVVDDQALVHLNGSVIVKPGAQGISSFLETRILLLSEKAKAEAIPNLEIEANDVKCSHAATIGQVDDEQLFYLQSRGISNKQAKQMISEAFLNLKEIQ